MHRKNFLMSVNYSDYLQLTKLLHAQEPESDKQGHPAHDEMLFIVIHQAYELWFKQILHEVDSVEEIMKKPELDDNSPELQTVVHRLSRVVTILKVLVHQIDIMETMTPMDFLDFRDMLRPASGFQSWQFKLVEARLGLRFENRHGQQYYISQLRPEQVALIKEAEEKPTLIELLNGWLERMPFIDLASAGRQQQDFWNLYREAYGDSLAEAEQDNLIAFDRIFSDGSGKLSARACRAAVFIMLYRGYPILQLPFQLLNSLLEVDEQLGAWRHRHMNMVHRMIGSRIGTGGSTGKDYLRAAMEKHYIFAEIASLTSFLIERRKLPRLSEELEAILGFRLKP